MLFIDDSQIIFQTKIPVILGGFKFVGVGLYLSAVLLWLFLQGLAFLAERYSRMISPLDWWRSAAMAVMGMMVGLIAWQIPGMFSKEEATNVVAAMTSTLICGFIAAWILIGRLYTFEFLHKIVVSLGVPIFYFCAIALGKVLEFKMTGH